LNSRRKSNVISELFSPYKPEDFSGFIDEYLANRVSGSNSKRERWGQQTSRLLALCLALTSAFAVVAKLILAIAHEK
jgi:dimethylaniline monooxygenase (N-oxide forming)